MKIKSIACLIIGLLFSFNFNLVFAQSKDDKTSKVIRFDRDKFIQNINTSLGRVMGYQVVLLKQGMIAAETSGGKARNAADGEAVMKLTTPSNIGSTAKFFAGVALLKILENDKSGKSVDELLEQKAYTFLPDIWQKTMHPSIKVITLRDLLQHKSGFPDKKPDCQDCGTFYAYLLKGVTLPTEPDSNKIVAQTKFVHGKRNYANANFTILTYIIPAIINPDILKAINNVVADKQYKPTNSYITTSLGNVFEHYMKGRVFGQITPVIKPSCDAPNEYPKQNIAYAKAYASVADEAKGYEWSERASNGACHAQGGWYLSGRELAAFAANFVASETLVSNSMRAKMFNVDKADDRLVWSGAYGRKWAIDNFGIKSMPFMNGKQEGYRSVLAMLPGGYSVIGIINSSNMDTGPLLTALCEAFEASVSF